MKLRENLNVQNFYRSLGRNGYNLGLLMLEDGTAGDHDRALKLRAMRSKRFYRFRGNVRRHGPPSHPRKRLP